MKKNWQEIHNSIEFDDIEKARSDLMAVINGDEAEEITQNESGDEYEHIEEDESNDEYEHIEEEEQSFAMKLKKERCFTQYFILNGSYYYRSIICKKKEFDGDIENPSDLKIVESIFERGFKNYVPFGEDPSDYYDEFDGDLETEFDEFEYYDIISGFVKGYLNN